MKEIILRIRWIFGLYSKTSIVPVTYEAFKEMYGNND